MLNYIWLFLIALGIGTALITDVADLTKNKYRNDENIPAIISLDENFDPANSKSYTGKIIISQKDFQNIYSGETPVNIEQNIAFNFDAAKKSGSIFFKVNENSPAIWKEIAKGSGKEDDISGEIKNLNFINDTTLKANLTLEEISFVKLKDVTNAVIDYAGIAVNIAIGLIGVMALWLGIMKIAEEAGLIQIIAKALKPVMKFLFPEVPSDHPAIGAIIMNMSANMLGLSNAATPFGLKAMEELDKLNPVKGTATNAMCTFLAINTAGLTLIPATAIAVRAASGSSNPAIIIGTSLFGAACATITGITAAKILEKFPFKFSNFGNWISGNIRFIFISLFVLAVAFAMIFLGAGKFVSNFVNPDSFKSAIQVVSAMAIPFIILSFIIYGAVKKVKIYEKFVEGAKEGFNVAVKIIPYLVAMLVAIGIFRAGGAMNILISILEPLTNLIGMPPEALTMAIMRPLSGSASLGIMTDIIAKYGADSYLGILVSTFFGSTETTFYVLAVYFGAVNIVRTRHAVAAGLLADVAGMLGALFIVKLLFG